MTDPAFLVCTLTCFDCLHPNHQAGLFVGEFRSLEVGVQVIKAGESADKKSRFCHAVLEQRKAQCSKHRKLQPPPRSYILS